MPVKLHSSVLIAIMCASCRRDPALSTHAPALVASGRLTGLGNADSGFVIVGTINGHRLEFVADYGSNSVALAERSFDSLRIPRPYANATRVKTTVLQPGIEPVLDSTANAVVRSGETVTQYWGDFEPLIVDSLRLGASLQGHVVFPAGALSSSEYSIEGLIGRDILSQFDLELDGPRRVIRLYDRTAHDTSARTPPWLPPGVARDDCLPAVVVGPRAMPTTILGDTAGMTEAEKRDERDGIVGVRRLLDQIELKFPTLIDGHPIDATFDSGTSDAIINWAAARLLGLTLVSPRIRPDSTDPTTIASVNDIVLRVGTHTLASPIVWIADTKFRDEAEYKTKPMMLLGLRQFRDRVLFLSHSTRSVCIGSAK